MENKLDTYSYIMNASLLNYELGACIANEDKHANV